MTQSTVIRIWASTRDKMTKHVQSAHPMRMNRTADVLTHAWEQRRASVVLSSQSTSARRDEFQSLTVWRQTYERIEAIRQETALDRIWIVDVLVEGWRLLNADQRDEAIRSSMASTETATDDADEQEHPNKPPARQAG